MVRSWRSYALALIAATSLGQAADAQGQASPASAREGATAAKSDAPESIFNGQVRRYRFALEGRVVTADTAEAFMVRYQGRGKERPRIIGAYADDEQNALVVVAAPEAEQAIRDNLAEWIVDPQHAKPGNKMPGLALSNPDLEALLAYLEGLK